MLDSLLGREEYVAYSDSIFLLGEESNYIQLITSPLAVANVHYIFANSALKGARNKHAVSLAAIDELLKYTDIVDLPGPEARFLLSAPGVKDYEDALQLASAKAAGARYLITRNVNNYPGGTSVGILHSVDDAPLIRAIDAVEGRKET